MKKMRTISLLLLFSTFLVAQKNVVVGTVYGIVTKNGTPEPVPIGTSVSIPGVDNTTTKVNGRYSLDLSGCKECLPGEKVKIYVNSDIGYVKKTYTITRNPSLHPFDIVIKKNNKFTLQGVVKDKKTGKGLKGVEVNIVMQDYDFDIPPIITDRRGLFSAILRKNNIIKDQAVTIFLSDLDNGKYADMDEVVFLNKYAPIELRMDECADCGARHRLKINTFIKTKILIEEGDLVTIKADGVIRVGSFVGTSGPEGVANNRGVLGMSLEQYNFFKTWNHAVLVYRFGEDDEWKFYDNQKENKYLAQESGYLELGVNDNNVNDNSGSYNVEVIIRR